MKFIVDAQLPKRLCKVINELDNDCIHTLDLANKNRTVDNKIIAIALEEERIVITKDHDFLQSHLLKKMPPKLLLISTGNLHNKTLLQLFRSNLDLIGNLFQQKDFIELTRTDIIVHD